MEFPGYFDCCDFCPRVLQRFLAKLGNSKSNLCNLNISLEVAPTLALLLTPHPISLDHIPADFLTEATPESLSEALREEGRGSKNTRWLLSASVLLLAILGVIIGSTLNPTAGEASDDTRIEQVVQSLEAGLQTADPDVREQLVSNVFCSGMQGSGAAAILANLPGLPTSESDVHGRIRWVSLQLEDLSMKGTSAEGTLVSTYHPEVLRNTQLPAKQGNVTIGFRQQGARWCIA